MVSDNSQLGDTHYNRQVIFTDKQQESVMEITANVDTRSTTTEHGVILKCAPTVKWQLMRG
ncbi:adhesin [Escherichia coli]|uniref:Adhesin n=1 Tax=Escherichia coli TaxID=562 RepID=A0A2X3K7N3_ECOLX|nr:adhesin [Escherichia coli]